MTFEEQLAMAEEIAADPNSAKIAVERAKMFVKLFSKLYSTLAPDDDDAKYMYESLVESYLHGWLLEGCEE